MDPMPKHITYKFDNKVSATRTKIYPYLYKKRQSGIGYMTYYNPLTNQTEIVGYVSYTTALYQNYNIQLKKMRFDNKQYQQLYKNQPWMFSKQDMIEYRVPLNSRRNSI